ncbi:MAG: response regulator [Desulfatiglandaceae bacterium]
MKILIVEDDPVSMRVLEAFLEDWGYEVVTARNENQAWESFQESDAPSIVISGWMMPFTRQNAREGIACVHGRMGSPEK